MSREACANWADEHGFQKGYDGADFAGDYGTKGCYAYQTGSYANQAYFGTGGSIEEMSTHVNNPESHWFRPSGNDCLTGQIERFLYF